MRSYLYALLFLATLFLGEIISAASHIAVVVNIRGTVTQLAPGALQAREIRLGDKLYQDTSIVTHSKSFIRLKYLDGSLMSIGPEGKAVLVQFENRGTNIVSLLKGKLRAKVNEEHPGAAQNKFYVKTRSAALGVRGTEFQTVFNPENQLTSLVTYKGEVALAKTAVVSPLPVETNQTTHPEKSDLPNKEEIEQALTKESVVVPAGQFSGVVGGLTKPTVPVQISPVQLNALYKNDELLEKKSAKSIVVASNETPIKDELKTVPQLAPPEGFYDSKNGLYAPKSGGMIDMETGIYIPPGKNDQLDPLLGLYVSKDQGNIDQETGQYIPPKGLILDAKRGFIAKGKNDSAATEVLVAMSKELNTAIAQDIVLTAPVSGPLFVLPTTRDLFRRNNATFSFRQMGETLNVDNDPTYGSKSFKSTSASQFDLAWDHQSPANFQFVTKFGWRSVEFDKDSDVPVAQGSNTLFSMAAGAKFFLSLQSYLYFEAQINQQHYVRYDDDENSAQMLRANVTKFKLSYYRRFFERKKSYFNGEAGGILLQSKRSRDLNIERGYGYFANLGWNYFYNIDYWGSLYFGMQNESQPTKNGIHENDSSRSNAGVGFTIGKLF